MSKTWTVFGRANCKWCDKALELLENHREQFDYYGIDTNPILKTVLLRMGLTTVPAIFYGPFYVGGYEDLVENIEAEEDWDDRD